MISKPVLLFAGVGIAAGILLFSLENTRTFSSQPTATPEPNLVSRFAAGVKQLLPQADPTPTPAPQPSRLSPVPGVVKAVYLTAWSGGSEKKIDEITALADRSELNGVVIDVKDYTGEIAFRTRSDAIHALGSETEKIRDFPAVVSKLHEHGIYVIARIAVFQDPFLAQHKPELAVADSRTGKPWRDNKGLSWVDPGSRAVWDYNAGVAEQAVLAGVDEVNFDYVRFPSDGNLDVLMYPDYDSNRMSKADQIEAFFKYLSAALRPAGAKLSVDLFGLSTLNKDDLGIGQVLEDALPYFDYVDPMVYPSHYASGAFGYKNPALYPYEVVYRSLKSAMARRERLVSSSTALMASSTPPALAGSPKTNIMEHVGTIRPWLQAFNLGATYTPDMVRAQMQATYDAGFMDGWYVWNPSNIYNPKDFLPE